MQQLWRDVLEIHFALGADASTLYSLLSTVAQTLAATMGFSIAFVLMRLPAIEAQVEAIDVMLDGTNGAISKSAAWNSLISGEHLEALEAAFRSAKATSAAGLPTLAEIRRAHERAAPLLAHWSTVRLLFHWTMMVNALVIVLTIGLLAYVPWLAKDATRSTAICGFALAGAVVGIGMSFGLANVLVRRPRITRYDPPA